MRNDTVVAYVATPHAGYLKFFRAYRSGKLFVLGQHFIAQYPSLTRHLPGNEPGEVRTMIDALGIFSSVSVITSADLPYLRRSDRVVMPDEDVSRAFAAQYLPNTPVAFDNRWRLRWDKPAVLASRRPEGEGVVSFDEFDRRLMVRADELSTRSPDWWRQIGALLVRNGEIILSAYNTHRPSEQSAYLLGDPRSNFDAGEHTDLSLALHAEGSIIAQASRRGISTEGCDLYVTTFPCTYCAPLVAESGIRRLYYADGYSRIEGAAALRSRGIEIIRVEKNNPPP
jgi:dCMP deaminase